MMDTDFTVLKKMLILNIKMFNNNVRTLMLVILCTLYKNMCLFYTYPEVNK